MSGGPLDPHEFDPETVTTLCRQAKSALRKRLGSLRRALPVAAAAQRSSRIVSNLLRHDWLSAARGVALYAAISARREPDLTELHLSLEQRGVRLYYPFMDPIPSGYKTGFRLWRPGDILEPRSFSFAEPEKDAPLAQRGDIDVVVVPALGVTLDGHRLGSGSGFFDATLPDLCPPAKSIVVAYDFQCLVELPMEPHDLPCDDVVTDKIG
jgi:5-formyltetrahydrofolate cyclo-ligase